MRIITGQFKGRRLLAPRGQGTRPITDRVKVALFDIMTPLLPDAAVADLFCGTGSLGLEALSRGSRHCWFAERDRSAVALLKRNVQAVGAAERATIWQGDVLRRLRAWLGGLPGPLDVVFLDPPYAMARKWRQIEDDPQAGRGAGDRLLKALAGALSNDGVVVFRTARSLAPARVPPSLTLDRRREYGSMALDFFVQSRRADTAP